MISSRLIGSLAVALLVGSAGIPHASSEAEGTPPAPEITAGLELGPKSFLLSWAPLVDAAVDGEVRYNVYRLVADGSFILIGTTSALAYAEGSYDADMVKAYGLTAINVRGLEGAMAVLSLEAEGGSCVRMHKMTVAVSMRDCVGQ